MVCGLHYLTLSLIKGRSLVTNNELPQPSRTAKTLSEVSKKEYRFTIDGDLREKQNKQIVSPFRFQYRKARPSPGYHKMGKHDLLGRKFRSKYDGDPQLFLNVSEY